MQTFFLPQSVAAFGNEGMRIVVDAGHGGIDGGVSGVRTGVKESDVNLSIAYALKARLEEMGFEVIMTRKTEAGLYGAPTKGFKRRDMEARQKIIEKASPLAVISIHQNFYSSRSVRGGQVFYNGEQERSGALGEAIQTELNTLYGEIGVKNRGAKAGNYFILECTDFPSVIVECGFLSNPNDDELLCSSTWKGRLSQAIAAGVMGYLSGSFA